MRKIVTRRRFLTFVLYVSCAPPSVAQWAVVDWATVQALMQQLNEMGRQLAVLQQNLIMVTRVAQSVSSARNFGEAVLAGLEIANLGYAWMPEAGQIGTDAMIDGIRTNLVVQRQFEQLWNQFENTRRIASRLPPGYQRSVEQRMRELAASGAYGRVALDTAINRDRAIGNIGVLTRMPRTVAEAVQMQNEIGRQQLGLANAHLYLQSLMLEQQAEDRRRGLEAEVGIQTMGHHPPPQIILPRQHPWE